MACFIAAKVFISWLVVTTTGFHIFTCLFCFYFLFDLISLYHIVRAYIFYIYFFLVFLLFGFSSFWLFFSICFSFSDLFYFFIFFFLFSLSFLQYFFLEICHTTYNSTQGRYKEISTQVTTQSLLSVLESGNKTPVLQLSGDQ